MAEEKGRGVPRRGARPAGKRRSSTGTPTRRGGSESSVEEAEVEIEIGSLATFQESVNICLYGPTGHGKTILSHGAPNSATIATEAGVKTAKRVGHTGDIITCPTWEHVTSSIKWADRELGPNDWLIVDSGTKAQLLYARWLLGVRHAENDSRDIDIPQLQDHQKWQNAIMRWFDHIISAQYNTISIFADMRRENDDGEDEVLPQIRGGRHLEVCRYVISQMDMLLYYAVTDKSDPPGMRRLLAQPHPSLPFVVKDRYDVLGDYWDIEPEDYTAMSEICKLVTAA